jgi:hypothetical protein
VKFLIVAVGSEELFVGAALYDAPVVEHTDLVGILDG